MTNFESFYFGHAGEQMLTEKNFWGQSVLHDETAKALQFLRKCDSEIQRYATQAKEMSSLWTKLNHDFLLATRLPPEVEDALRKVSEAERIVSNKHYQALLPLMAQSKDISLLANPLGEAKAILNELNLERYRLPEFREIEAISTLANAFKLPDGYAQFSISADEIARRAATIKMPCVNVEDPTRSVASFAQLSSLSNAVRGAAPFGDELATILQRSFGDWSTLKTEDLFTDPVRKRALRYMDFGFDPKLIAFPSDSFDAVVRSAGFSVGDQSYPKKRFRPSLDCEIRDLDLCESSEHMREAYELLARFEAQIRSFIDREMTSAVGVDWFKHRLPGDMRKRWEARRQTAIDSGMPDAPLIAYADFSDYVQIIVRSDNWREIFHSIFRRATLVENRSYAFNHSVYV